MTCNKNKSREIDSKSCTCYYFGNIIDIYDLDLDNILLDKKSNQNPLIYHVAYKIPYGLKLLCIVVDRHIKKEQ